jgi:hypothetical protein
MMNDHVLRNHELESRLAGPYAQIVILKKAKPISFVEAANLFDDLPADKEAKAREPFHAERLTRELLAVPDRE